jgi:hypothetical protein
VPSSDQQTDPELPTVLEGFCVSPDCEARQVELKEAIHAKAVPNTQTGSLTDNQHGTNDALIDVDSTFNNLFMATPSPCTTIPAATTR